MGFLSKIINCGNKNKELGWSVRQYSDIKKNRKQLNLNKEQKKML